ncbi:MAG: 1-deoxy-D-xylulose-5-phosphate reductoisomerase [Lachnospiraceae bacterium]|nr:1-deoxy-D-xylulose-5-phosphate reductoisomerase [Lachnospiraceae bacterium]
MKRLSILGSTGSIGTQTLDIVDANRNALSVASLAAFSNVSLMEEQIRKYKPGTAALYDEAAAEDLKVRVSDTDTRILSGMEGIIETAVCPSEITVGAMVGMIGIKPALAAIREGHDLALANKETLVTAGHIITGEAKANKVKILPVDSEHSAIFQSLNGESHDSIEKILLTASGGPFRNKSPEELKNMTAAEALKHPNWNMGPKVTIDSSTLVNKGLEVMEARWLFDVSYDDIEVLIHPQSIVHSAVRFKDGAVMAELGIPDMHLPIQYALFYPERRDLNMERLDLIKIRELTFFEPDLKTFRGLSLALKAARTGGTMPTVFNAANEEAVKKFLKGKISYPGITEIIEKAMDMHKVIPDPGIDEILQCEKEVREMTAASEE